MKTWTKHSESGWLCIGRHVNDLRNFAPTGARSLAISDACFCGPSLPNPFLSSAILRHTDGVDALRASMGEPAWWGLMNPAAHPADKSTKKIALCIFLSHDLVSLVSDCRLSSKDPTDLLDKKIFSSLRTRDPSVFVCDLFLDLRWASSEWKVTAEGLDPGPMEQCNGPAAHRKVFFDETNTETAARRPCESGKENESSPTLKKTKWELRRRFKPINDCAINIEDLEPLSGKSVQCNGPPENQHFRNESSTTTSCFRGVDGDLFVRDGDHHHAVEQRICQKVLQEKPSYRTRLRTIGK